MYLNDMLSVLKTELQSSVSGCVSPELIDRLSPVCHHGLNRFSLEKALMRRQFGAVHLGQENECC